MLCQELCNPQTTHVVEEDDLFTMSNQHDCIEVIMNVYDSKIDRRKQNLCKVHLNTAFAIDRRYITDIDKENGKIL